MKSSIHLELTPCDSTSTTTSTYKTCLLNTSCDHQLHLDHTNTSPELQDHSIVGSAEPKPILDSEDLLQLDSISVSPQATCNFETESLPEFKGQLDEINQEPTDTPSTIPTAFQAPRDDTYNHECTHNPMAIQCNQYPNPSHNSALPQFLAHHNCEDLDPTDTPSAVPTALQAPNHCTHIPSTSQVKKSNHTNPMVLPYPPDPREHVMERSAAPTALVEKYFIYDFPKSLKHIKEADWGDKLKLNYTTYGYILMEIDWGGKFSYTSCGCPMTNRQGHETHPIGHNTSEVDWGGHDSNPNHVNESLLSEVDWGAHKPDVDDPEQLTGESIQYFLTLLIQLQWLIVLGRLVAHTQVTTLPKLMVA